MSFNQYFAALLLCLAAAQLQADDTSWLTVDQGSGLLFQLPAAPPRQLMEDVQKLRSRLIARKAELSGIMQETELGATETLLSIILPGGLVYASYMTLNHQHAETRLQYLKGELQALNRDLLMLRTANGEVAVAMLP